MFILTTNCGMQYERVLYAGYSLMIFFVELLLSMVILQKYIPLFKLFKFNSIFSIPDLISFSKILFPSKLSISMTPLSVLNSEHFITILLFVGLGKISNCIDSNSSPIPETTVYFSKVFSFPAT